MADIFDEVSEELKQDQLIKTWKKYSKLILSSIVFIIICLISYQIYLNWENKKKETISKEYFQALKELENKNFSDSKRLFSENIKKHENGYRMLSLFGLAESNFKNGNIKEMILNYKLIYEDDSIDIYYRNLSRILCVLKDNQSSYDQQKMILNPILTSPSTFQPLAAELEVILLIKFNKLEEAENSLKTLLQRSDLSIEQINRLKLISKIYGSNVQ